MSYTNDELNVRTTEEILKKNVYDLQEQLNNAHKKIVELQEEIDNMCKIADVVVEGLRE